MKASKRLVRLLATAALGAGTVLSGPTAALGVEPGSLDPSFGRDGVRYVDFGRREYADILSVDDVGRLQLAGVRTGDPDGLGPYRIALTRLDASGSVDRSFGDRGRVLFNPTEGGYDPASVWARAPDDRLVVVGADGTDGGSYLARFRRNGSIDRSFGDSGLVFDSLPDDVVHTLNLAVQPSGRILTLSRTETGCLVKAYRPDGSTARGFGRNGTVRIARNFTQTGALTTRPDGRILVVGTPNRIFGSKPDPKLIIHGLLPDGSPDRDFGRDGRAAMPIDIPNAELLTNASTVLPSGKVVVAGQIGTFSSDAFVARFSTDGRVDTSFGGGDGWRRFGLGPIDASNAIVKLSGKRLAVIGYVYNDLFGDRPDADLFVAALRQDGRFWKRFGDGGVVRDDFGRDRDSVVATDGAVVDGTLIVAGGARGDMFAARYFLDRD